MLSPTLFRTGLRDLLRRPLQTGLMVLGIALGVAVVIAIDLANTSASRAFNLSTEAVTGRATHQIVGGPTGLPEDLYRTVRVEWGYRLSAPVVEGVVQVVGLDEQPLRVLGVDAFAEAPFRSYLTESSTLATNGLERFYTEAGAVLVSAGLAERYGLQVGSAITLQVADQVRAVTIVGLLVPPNANQRLALENLLLADLATAQELLRQTGTLTRIDLILTDAEATALAAQLPQGIRLVSASTQADTVSQLTAAFQLNLTALSLLALVVGMFLIYNTVMFNVVQRRVVLGTLRALGVTGDQLFILILAETALVAVVGAILGLGLGWVLGQGAVRLVTQTINDLYYVLSVREAPLSLLSALKGVGLGVGAGLLAALAPALEAASVEPVTAMRRSTLEDRVRPYLPYFAGAGGLLILLGVGLIWLITDSLVASLGGLFSILFGIALTVPLATVWLMQALTPVLGHLFGALGRLATRTVIKAISRTSIAIAALMIAVSVTIGVSVMISSFRSTVVNWLDLTIVADIYISAPRPSGATASGTISPTLPALLAQVPGVRAVESVRGVTVDSEFGPVYLSAADVLRRRATSLYRFAAGDPAVVWDEMVNGAIIVSEPFAYRHNLPPQGGRVTLYTDHGPQVFPVAGIFYDYSSDQGLILMAQPVYRQHWDDPHLTAVALYVNPEANVEEVAANVRTALKGMVLEVQVNRVLREEAMVVFDRTFAITNALRILAVVVAFIGVLSALMALQIERSRELATLQALGLTAAQLWRLTFLETGLMGATAGLLSLPTGFVLALVLIYVINLRSFGWTIVLQNDAWVYVQALGVSILAALCAAIYPLRRLLRMPIAAALRQE